MVNSSVLRELVGRRVAIYGNAGTSDDGLLMAFDDVFVKVEVGKSYLYFPIVNIRLIKPID